MCRILVQGERCYLVGSQQKGCSVEMLTRLHGTSSRKAFTLSSSLLVSRMPSVKSSYNWSKVNDSWGLWPEVWCTRFALDMVGIELAKAERFVKGLRKDLWVLFEPLSQPQSWSTMPVSGHECLGRWWPSEGVREWTILKSEEKGWAKVYWCLTKKFKIR